LNVKPPPAPVRLTVEAPLRPSEDPEKVVKAVGNIVGDVNLAVTRGRDSVVVETEDHKGLHIIYEKIRSKQSLGVARRRLLENISEDSTWLYLNKQAAYVNTFNICEDEAESPLGPIKVTIQTKDPQKIIDWLAPRQPE
jgi:predicted RNA binding protein with dsRBD fold (UPF0201 family)